MSYGEFGEEEKALNLMEIIVEKPTIEIKIFQLEVGGLTLLIIFCGLDFHIRASVHCGGPLLILIVTTHFWRHVLHYGM